MGDVRVPQDLRVEPQPAATPVCLATGTHECGLGLPMEDCETLRDRVVWLVHLRWWVVVAGLAAAALGWLTFPDAADWPALGGIVGMLGAFNAFWQLRVRHGAKTLCGGVLPLSSYQILTDFVLLAVAVHFTGGVAGPLVPLFVLHGVFSAVLLPRWHTTAMLAAAGVLLLGSLALQQGLDWLPPWHFEDVDFRPAGLAEAIRVGFLAIATLGATAIGLSLSHQLRTRHRRIAALARDLEARNAELRRLDEQRVRLLGVASHDLRSPLSAIELRIDLFLSGYAGEVADAQREHLLRVKGRLRELRAFVEDLLDFTAVESRRGPPTRTEPVDVTAQLRDVVRELEPLAQQAGLQVRAELLESPVVVQAHPARLSLAWTNLLSNAIKYGGGRDVTVSQRLEGGRVQVRVADQGLGISAEDRERLFTEFYRAPSVRASGIPGTGLGLAITKHVVDSLGGDITVESEPGKGTTFTLVLPISG